MFKGKEIKSFISKLLRQKKVLSIAVALCLISIIVTGITIAWLSDQSEPLTNTFQSAEVTCDIDEVFDNETKQDVRIQNTGTMDAYIRAALVPVWKDGDDIVGVAVLLTDYDIVWGAAYGTEWVEGNDGYYYCNLPMSPSAFTPELIDECSVLTDNGYRFELQIAAQAVQALPASVVVDIWDAVTSVNTNGTLEVAQ